MSKLKAFIFDMDGTLVDNMRFHAEAWSRILSQVGEQVDPKEFQRRIGGMPTVEILREIFGDSLSEAEIRHYTERKESMYRSLYDPSLELVEGLNDFLREARSLAIPMGIATSAKRPNIRFVLGSSGLEPYFDVVVGKEDVERGKPHPDLFLTAARKLGVPASQCIVFEDSPAGVEAAGRAGMRVIGVATTFGESAFRESPVVVKVIENFVSLTPQSVLETPLAE